MRHLVHVAALFLVGAVLVCCAPDIEQSPRPDVVIADFDPDADRLPYPFDALSQDNPHDVALDGYAELCDLSRCPEDPDERYDSEERCRCVDFQEWDDEELVPARRDADPALALEWKIKRRLHRLDGFPVTVDWTFSTSHAIDMVSLDQRVKGARESEGEESRPTDVPGFGSSPLLSSLAEVSYDDPEAPGRETSRWLVSLAHPEPLIQRNTYVYAIEDGVHGQDKTRVPAYTVTQRYLPDGQPNPDCDQALGDTTCKAFNPDCLETPGAEDETCEIHWPMVVDAATWFALSAEPLCEYIVERNDEELFELLEHHQLPECLESATEALDHEDAIDLEKLRLNFNEALNDEALQTALKVDRTRVELLWASTTQSIGMPLQKARADLYRGVIPVPAQVGVLTEVTPPSALPHVAGAYLGRLTAPDLRDPDGLLLDSNGADVPTHEVPFLISVPSANGGSCTAPYKVALVAHGLGGSKDDLWGVADALGSECLAALALDLPGHGDHPIGELWSDDPFLITGNLQQGAVELMQAVRALDDQDGPGPLEQALAAAGAGAEQLNSDQPGLVAASIGAIVGSTTMAVDPEITFGVLSAIAGGWSDLLPSIDSAGYLPPGTLDALQAWHLNLGPREIDVTGWAMERMDPAAYLRQYCLRRKHWLKDLHTRRKVQMKDKRVLIQAPTGDSVLPEGATRSLALSWCSEDPTTIVRLYEPSGGHRVLFDDGVGHELAAAQAARFLSSSGTEVLEEVKR